MKVLVLGADGMLGHRLLIDFNSMGLNVAGTVRKPNADSYVGKFPIENYQIFYDVDASYLTSVENVFREFQPDYVVNCIGYIKQRDSSQPALMIHLNAVFPHLLAEICERYMTKLFLMSTDCVFSGSRGNYNESDEPDARDMYGISKRLGEISSSQVMTLRTSIIGHELFGHESLLEWFLRQADAVYGFKRAIFSGFTTNEISNIIGRIIIKGKFKGGIYQISASPISKYDLLSMIRKIYKKDIDIKEDYNFKCDRSLDSSRFREDFKYQPPTWNEMLETMALKKEIQ